MTCYIQHNVGELTNATLNIGARGSDGDLLATISIRFSSLFKLQNDSRNIYQLNI